MITKCVICSVATSLGCSNCEKVFYCSAECQTKHWGKHKAVCTGRSAKIVESKYETYTGNILGLGRSPP